MLYRRNSSSTYWRISLRRYCGMEWASTSMESTVIMSESLQDPRGCCLASILPQGGLGIGWTYIRPRSCSTNMSLPNHPCHKASRTLGLDWDIRPVHPASYDVRSWDVEHDGVASPPTAFHSEIYREGYAWDFTKRQGPKWDYPTEDESSWHSSEM